MKHKIGYFVIAAAMLLSVQELGARVVTGTVKGANKPLGGVIVTDGYSLIRTDHTGAYSIGLNEKAEFVYIVTPKGYVADYSSGVPQFYQRLDDKKAVYNFDLKQMKGDADRYAMITMADPQIDTDEDAEKLMGATLKDIQETAAQYTDVQLAGIVLGDISWDMYNHNETYKAFARQLSFPVYPVIGNHDFDKFVTPSDTADYEAQYKKSFGPVYYAFQLSDAFYVVLSNMHYMGNKRYRVTLDEMPDQMHWLEQLLNSAINMGNRIYGTNGSGGETQYAFSDTYNSSADGQLATRKAVYNLYTAIRNGGQCMVFCGDFTRNSSQNVSSNTSTRILITGADVYRSNLMGTSNNAIRIDVAGTYWFRFIARLSDTAGATRAWYIGGGNLSSMADDQMGGSWNYTFNRHKAEATYLKYCAKNEIIAPWVYVESNAATVQYVTVEAFKLNDK